MSTFLWLGLLAALCGIAELTMEIRNKCRPEVCFPPPTCDPHSQYRTIDGSCNNPRFRNWGKSRTSYLRYKTSDREYGENLEYDGTDGLNSRMMSRKLYTDGKTNDEKLNIQYTITAQIIAHDTSRAAFKNPADECCSNGEAIVNSTCASISISKDDPVYAQYKKTCIGVDRTTTTRDSGCIWNEPINTVTHFIDLSFIYGNNEDEEKEAREWKYGRLQTRTVNGKDYLPIQPTNKNCDARADVCHKGDPRVDQNLGITYDTTIWVRWHNYIAGLIQKQKPLWTDNIVYEEARSIVIATFQNVIYSEWLPLAIPPSEVNIITKEKYFHLFTHPGTFLEFATVCFRLLHSMIPNEYPVKNAAGVTVDKFSMAEWMKRSDIVDNEVFLHQFSYGVSEPCQKQDQTIAHDIQNYIFNYIQQNNKSRSGDDLIATDITRGRDHNVASYPAMVKQVLDLDIKSWDDMYTTGFFTTEDILKMQKIYPGVKDIEFYAATSLEGKVSGSLWGPTCTKLVSEQFYNWRGGDRWWFDLENRPYPWNTKQLDIIYDTSFAFIKCKALGLDFVYENSFIVGSADNKIITCNDLPDIAIDELLGTSWGSSSILDLGR